MEERGGVWKRIIKILHTCSYLAAWKLTLPESLWVFARARASPTRSTTGAGAGAGAVPKPEVVWEFKRPEDGLCCPGTGRPPSGGTGGTAGLGGDCAVEAVVGALALPGVVRLTREVAAPRREPPAGED